jgi:hypothetical protein
MIALQITKYVVRTTKPPIQKAQYALVLGNPIKGTFGRSQTVDLTKGMSTLYYH